MKTLKSLINNWLTVNQDKHDKALEHSKKRHSLCIQILHLRLERVSMHESGLVSEDKELADLYYQKQIDKLNSELYFTELFYDLDIQQ